MSRKKLLLFGALLVAVVVYFLLFQKDKTLKFIPESADAVVLIDVKNLSRQYIYTFASHPSQWFNGKGEKSFSLKGSGLKIPDFVQIFHLKDSRFSHWYSVVEIKDQKKFLSFLKDRKFINKGNKSFQKDQIFLKIEGEFGIFGTSNTEFAQISKQVFQPNKNDHFDANQFFDEGVGSVSFLYGKEITNFSIVLSDDDIEIKNTANIELFSSVINKILGNNQFLEIELDEKNIKNTASFFNKGIGDSAKIKYLKASSNLQQVNDTIITYDYDDDFNEIEKIAVQKIVEPNYAISLQSKFPQQTWEYFQNKKWINNQNQFTAIPFQPNIIVKSSDKITIKSTKYPVEIAQQINENYIFIKNNQLLLKNVSTFSEQEKNWISTIDFIFYGNKMENYYLKVQMKKGALPLILR